MQVRVERTRCHGHALCGSYAPGIFDYHDEGYSVVPDNDVAPEHEATARGSAQRRGVVGVDHPQVANLPNNAKAGD